MSARPRNRAPAARAPDFAALLRRWRLTNAKFQLVPADDDAGANRALDDKLVALGGVLAASIGRPIEAAGKLRVLADYWRGSADDRLVDDLCNLAAELETLDAGRP